MILTFLAGSALIEIELPAGVASVGASENMATFNSFVKAPVITAPESSALWYTFNDLNSSDRGGFFRQSGK